MASRVERLLGAGITAEQGFQALTAYRSALRFSSTDAATVPFDDEKYEDYGYSDAARDSTADDLVDFLVEQHDNLLQFMEVTGRDWGDVGHDFALTRNQHGAGFASRGAAGVVVDQIIEACMNAGTVYLYLSDENEIEAE